ncbi:MAG TPA: hypothetical protein VMS17_24680 [Gemmataceae bacterium]|nr:hypothetical protein [Gemmataceae bacterium]
MHLILALALLLCNSAAANADDGPAVPDGLQNQSDDCFEVAIRGFTGAHIDVRKQAHVGRHCSFTTTTKEGTFVLMDILVRDGKEKGKMLVEVKLAAFPANSLAETVAFSDDLGPGETNIRGDGWNNLFEISLARK